MCLASPSPASRQKSLISREDGVAVSQQLISVSDSVSRVLMVLQGIAKRRKIAAHGVGTALFNVTVMGL